MMRFSVLASLAALMLAAPAVAQEAGGVRLSPEVLNTADAQQQAVNLAFSLLQRAQMAQQLQQPHGMLVGSGYPVASAPTDPNAVNPSDGRSSVNQQAITRLLGDPGYLAGFSRGQPLAASRIKPPPVAGYSDPSQTVVVNAVDSPVSIGNGNIVHQQVANSTAVGNGATASSAARNQGGGTGGGSVSQTASSAAASQGGVANSTASNSNTVQR